MLTTPPSFVAQMPTRTAMRFSQGFSIPQSQQRQVPSSDMVLFGARPSWQRLAIAPVVAIGLLAAACGGVADDLKKVPSESERLELFIEKADHNPTDQTEISAWVDSVKTFESDYYQARAIFETTGLTTINDGNARDLYEDIKPNILGDFKDLELREVMLSYIEAWKQFRWLSNDEDDNNQGGLYQNYQAQRAAVAAYLQAHDPERPELAPEMPPVAPPVPAG